MTLLRKYLFIQLLFLLYAMACAGQSYYFKHYQVDDGLAHNTVFCLMQDSKGFIWIGTKGGLNRFDGYSFKNYRDESNKFGTIGDNAISAIKEDSKGMIWVGTGTGIFKYDPFKEVFTQLQIPEQRLIDAIVIDRDNNVWFLCQGSLFCYNQKNDTLIPLNMRATCIALDKDMNICMGDADGAMTIYHPASGMSTKAQIIDSKLPTNIKFISAILPISDHELLIGTSKKGIKSYNTQTHQVASVQERNADNTELYVRNIVSAGNDDYWVATESGLYIYNHRTGQMVNLKKRAGDSFSLSDNAVYCVSKDNQGGLWAGTFFGGLNYYSKNNARFQKYYPLLGTSSISGNAVREICTDGKGNLWIGTEDAGINKLDKTGKFTNYTVNGTASGISYPNIHGLLVIHDKLYIGPFLQGMEIMDLKTMKIIDRFKLIGEKGNQRTDFVMSVYQTQDSTLLVGAIGGGPGLFSFDPKQKKFTRSKWLPEYISVYALIQDHTGTIWVGSHQNGAFYYNTGTGVRGNIQFGEQKNGKAAFNYIIQGIFEDSNHALWFATEGGGLIKLSADRKTLKKLTTENGLPSNNIFRMLEDNDKNLWISTLKGLIRLDLRTDKFSVYTQSNGLITDQFNYNSAFKDSEGKMYFGSVKGLIAFNPVEFRSREVQPPTFITGLQVNDREMVPAGKSSPLTKSIIYTDTVELQHDQSNFSIEFAALYYSSPKVTRYRYRMEGLNKNWTYLNTNRKAYFTDLSPGDYTFIVKAESNVGSWVGAEKKLFIKILPPIWKSTAAYLLYLVIFILANYWAIRYYHRYNENKNLAKLRLFEHQKEKEIYQAKIEFFTNIAHEIQTPLTLIIGPVERIMKKVDEMPALKKSLLMIEKNSNRLLELTGQLLDFRKTEADQFGLNFVNADITLLLRDQLAAFKEKAEKENITLSTDLPKKHVKAFVDVEALVKICGNLISNAIKYGATRVEVQIPGFDATAETFKVRFINDGKPIPEEFSEKIFEPFFRLRGDEKPGTGIGLSLARSLTELHSGTLRLVRDETGLIIFELILPVHQKFEFSLSKWKA